VVTTSPAQVVGGGVATAQVFPKGSPQDASTTDLLNTLRDHVIPAAARGKVDVLVSGQTAIFADFAGVLSSKLPLFIGVVVGLSFLLLMAVFRSLVIPLMAAAMNLLSVGAAFGVVTAVFQWGWLAGLIGVSRTGPIDAFLPVIVFAILFGLSMDYEVFLVSRITRHGSVERTTLPLSRMASPPPDARSPPPPRSWCSSSAPSCSAATT
jgi:RND superfamily putative drug exporter